eukprot:CAMPEP_0182868402 /NCGR_PEP_ID=MMETSP0034_2-20130328/9298_1 /TAXON_ID=156128 /ORGANISM="Nephroselmis pyriformis, Strain CCMP717" /LENGTH=38 /DNA_ID= /DNA_START= /DNA_END= /DNA_ORIENTATION=
MQPHVGSMGRLSLAIAASLSFSTPCGTSAVPNRAVLVG